MLVVKRTRSASPERSGRLQDAGAGAQGLGELGEKEEALHDWCKDREGALVVEATDETEEAYRTRVNRYPKMIGSLGIGTDYADQHVVAVAGVHDGTVIASEDRGFERHSGMKQRWVFEYA